MAHVSLSLTVQSCGGVRASCGTASPCYLVFDTETNGGTDQLCIELAFIVFDRNFVEVHRYRNYWALPVGHSMNVYAQKVHGISERTLREHGVDPRQGLENFYEWVDRVSSGSGGIIVAHNAMFDASVISKTSQKNGLARRLTAEECFCTMRRAKRHAGCKNKRGQERYPKNAELYEILHGDAPTWARLHSALDDVRVTARNLETGRNHGWWNI
jgi:DNA polymerase III epsilon subunit-like protein